jgi:hypothetical protein
MAYNLTPQEFAALQQQFLQQRAQAPTGEANSYYDSTNPYFANGTLYAPSYGDNAVAQGRAMNAAPTAYTTYDYNEAANNKQSLYNGQPYTSIDNAGNVTGNGNLSGFTDSSFMSEWGPFLMALGPMAATMSPALGAAASFGANPVTGATAAGSAAGAAGAGGAALGNSFDGGLLNSTIMNGVGSAEAAGGAGSAALGNSFDGGALNGAVVNGVGGETLPTLGTLSAGEMTMPALPGEMSTFGGAGPISSLFPASVAKYLGPAAALLGAVAGSQPVKQSTTQTRDIPDWLKPSVGGLLGYTNQKLAQDMAPGALAGYDQMKQVGQGLMSAPIAGNGFAQFTKGRY